MPGIPSTCRSGPDPESEGVGDVPDFLSFSPIDNLDDVEATGAFVPASPGQEGQCRTGHFPLLEGRDRLGRCAVAAPAACFHFDEDDQLPIQGDQVDLAATQPKAALDDTQAGTFEEPCGELLPAASEGLPRVAGGRSAQRRSGRRGRSCLMR